MTGRTIPQPRFRVRSDSEGLSWLENLRCRCVFLLDSRVFYVGRILVFEMSRWPLRIATTLRFVFRQYGAVMGAPTFSGTAMDRFLAERRYRDCCTRDIQSLSKRYRWIGTYDWQVLAEAHLMGYLLHCDTLRRESGSEGS